MALSTTFTQCAPESTRFGKITQNKSHFVVQGHSRSPILVSIESSYTTYYQWLILTYLLLCYLAPFARYSLRNVKNRYISLPHLRLNFRRRAGRGTPGTISLKFSVNGNGWPRYRTKRRRNIAENFNRLSRAHERYRRHTDDRQTDGR